MIAVLAGVVLLNGEITASSPSDDCAVIKARNQSKRLPVAGIDQLISSCAWSDFGIERPIIFAKPQPQSVAVDVGVVGIGPLTYSDDRATVIVNFSTSLYSLLPNGTAPNGFYHVEECVVRHETSGWRLTSCKTRLIT